MLFFRFDVTTKDNTTEEVIIQLSQNDDNRLATRCDPIITYVVVVLVIVFSCKYRDETQLKDVKEYGSSA